MANVCLSQPPALPGAPDYRKYRPWLRWNFFDDMCSYCLIRDLGLQVDHYEPRNYAPHRINDPTNTIPGYDGLGPLPSLQRGPATTRYTVDTGAI
jgi:hypothetical protein